MKAPPDLRCCLLVEGTDSTCGEWFGHTAEGTPCRTMEARVAAIGGWKPELVSLVWDDGDPAASPPLSSRIRDVRIDGPPGIWRPTAEGWATLVAAGLPIYSYAAASRLWAPRPDAGTPTEGTPTAEDYAATLTDASCADRRLTPCGVCDRRFGLHTEGELDACARSYAATHYPAHHYPAEEDALDHYEHEALSGLTSAATECRERANRSEAGDVEGRRRWTERAEWMDRIAGLLLVTGIEPHAEPYASCSACAKEMAAAKQIYGDTFVLGSVDFQARDHAGAMRAQADAELLRQRAPGRGIKW